MTGLPTTSAPSFRGRLVALMPDSTTKPTATPTDAHDAVEYPRTLEQLLERVRELPETAEALAESPVAPRDLSLNHHLIDDLGLDSIQLLTLAVAVENAFEVAFSEEDDEQLGTLRELLTRVLEQLPARPSSAPTERRGA